MTYDSKLATLIQNFMSQGDQWKTKYTNKLLFYIWQHYKATWPDGKPITFLIDGGINEYRMSLGPSIETILRHRRKIKADHNIHVNVDGIGIYWNEQTKEKELETIQNFT